MLETFNPYRVYVYNTAVEALIEYRVHARTPMRAKIVTRDFYSPDLLAKRILRVNVAALGDAPDENPSNWEPL